MKNKYQRMTLEQKKELKLKYKDDSTKKSMYIRLTRLLIIGILGLISSMYLFYTAFDSNGNIAEYIFAYGVLLMSIIFIIGSRAILAKELNKYALKQK